MKRLGRVCELYDGINWFGSGRLLFKTGEARI
jgi:hypothetical protein